MNKLRTIYFRILAIVKASINFKSTAVALLAQLILTSSALFAQSPSLSIYSPELNLQVNQELQGQYLIALYTVSSSPAVGYRPDSLHVERITGRIIKLISESSIKLESIELPKIPNFKSYNNLVLVVSPSAQFVWKNSLDSTVPDNQPALVNPTQLQFSAIKVIKASTVEINSNKIITVP